MKKLHKVGALAVAGKLALQMGNVSAAGLGKVSPDATSALKISLDEVGYPLEILTPPLSSAELNLNTSTGSKKSSSSTTGSGNDGKLYSEDIKAAFSAGKKPRIDFVVNNIQNPEHPVVVYLAYSTKLGSPTQWADLPLSISLDRKTLHVVAAYKIDPIASLSEFNANAPSPLGKLANNGNSVIIPVEISDLSHAEFAENSIYFQTVAVPYVNGQLVFAQATASELDHYVISKKSASAPNKGSKVAENNSKQSSSSSSGSSGSSSSGGGKSGSGSTTSTGGSGSSKGGSSSSTSGSSGSKK